MNDKDFVSIILPTYNGSKYLRQSIESCLAQTHRNLELIIIDDCSIDETPNIIRLYTDPRIKYFRNEKNMKLPQSLNVGFSQAKGQYLTWTSDDNYFTPTAIEDLLNFLKSKPDTDFVYSDYYLIDERGKISDVLTGSPDELLWKNSIGPCFLYKKIIFENIGGFDSDYFLCEDYEYWIRIYLDKFKIRKINSKLYYYRKHSGSLTGSTGANAMRGVEIKIIDKIFTCNDFKNNFFIKWRAISNCYFRTAILHREAKDLVSTLKCIFLAFLYYPLIALDQKYLKFTLITFKLSLSSKKLGC